MGRKIKEHYEKLLLSILLILLGFLGASPWLMEKEKHQPYSPASEFDPFEMRVDSGRVELQFRKPHTLMPGQTVSLIESNGTIRQKVMVEEVVFPRRSSLQITTKAGEAVEGRLSGQDELRLGLQWRNDRQPLTLATGRTNTNVPLQDVLSIRGDHMVGFSLPPGTDLEELTLSFYQSKEMNARENAERIKWEQTRLEGNETIYDLFTPPVIYLVDGKLSTSLPHDPLPDAKKKEPFGMELLRFSNEPYPYRLVSWIGETPYFEDTLSKNSATSDENVRNRLEVGIPYKRFPERKAGQPSLIKTSEEDEDKQLKVEKFVVQQYRDERTGGLKTIGRALVRDYKLGGEPFEINNQMKEVFAGNIKIEVRMTLEQLDGKTFSFTTADEGISFDFGDRVFTVSGIRVQEKSILVTKKGPGEAEKEEKLLALP